jgi:hypothetical protein
MRTLIQEIADELKQKSFDELWGIFEHASAKRNFEGKAVTVSIWRDRLSDTEVQIVVQGYRHFALGIGKIGAVGFQMTKSGNLRELRRDEIYQFV